MLLRDGYPSLIKRFGSKADFVVPVHGERVECEIAEIIQILKFSADALLHQRREINEFYCSVVKPKSVVRVYARLVFVSSRLAASLSKA